MVVVALSLGVLAAALIKLAGDSSSPASIITSTVTTAPAVTTPTPTTVTPRASTPAPPSATTSGPGAARGPLSKEPKVTRQSARAPSKLLINELITGTGALARPGERVTVNYVGVLFHSGQEFDSSWKRGQRFTFTLGTGQVILGWNQGVPGMRVGGRRELTIPAALAYGSKGFPTTVPIPPNETLVFVVDLLGVRK